MWKSLLVDPKFYRNDHRQCLDVFSVTNWPNEENRWLDYHQILNIGLNSQDLILFLSYELYIYTPN